jgi:hypothetical protein
METLSEDLVLLAIRPSGVIGVGAKLQYALAGSELVRLAALGRVAIEGGRIVVLDQAPTGDVLLDEALASLDDWVNDAKAWVAWDWSELIRRYLEKLAYAGTIQLERRRALGLIAVSGWTIHDIGRLASARARLDAIAYGTGDVDTAQAALAGLATAIGLPALIYPGPGGSAARRRIACAVRSIYPAPEITLAVWSPDGGIRAATEAESRSYSDAAVRVATDAAVRASIDAATQVAMSAVDRGHYAAAAGAHAIGRLVRNLDALPIGKRRPARESMR